MNLRKRCQFAWYFQCREILRKTPPSVRVAAILWNGEGDADHCVIHAAYRIHWLRIMRRHWLRHDVAAGLEIKHDDEFDYRGYLYGRFG